MKLNCPICNSNNIKLLCKATKYENNRVYYLCNSCNFVFVPSIYFVTKEEEKKRYLTHNNRMDDKNYYSFLKQMFDAIVPYIKKGSLGFDYGTGPCPMLPKIFEDHGFKIKFYDPFFYPDKALLNKTYDFVVSTETIEHFHNPIKEFELLVNLINKNGVIGLMTNMTDSLKSMDEFSSWYYQKDLTHVSFYSKKTFEYIARKFNLEAIFPAKNIVILRLLF